MEQALQQSCLPFNNWLKSFTNERFQQSQEFINMTLGLTKQHVITPVLQTKHYTGKLFTFKTVKPNNLTIGTGSSIEIGLIVNERPLLSKFFLCSPYWSNELEFCSSKVNEESLATYLHKLSSRNCIIVKTEPSITFNLNALKAGSRLYLLCTGRGIAPFVSLLFDPEVYNRYKQVIVVQTCRTAGELRYLWDKF